MSVVHQRKLSHLLLIRIPFYEIIGIGTMSLAILHNVYKFNALIFIVNIILCVIIGSLYRLFSYHKNNFWLSVSEKYKNVINFIMWSIGFLIFILGAYIFSTKIIIMLLRFYYLEFLLLTVQKLLL